jgi:hypothetical protein
MVLIFNRVASVNDASPRLKDLAEPCPTDICHRRIQTDRVCL